MKKDPVYDGFAKVYKDGIFEVVKVTDSIGVLIYDKTNDQFIFTKQIRRPMKKIYSPFGSDDGMTLEAPAGRFDKEIGVKQLIIAETKEEVGVTIIEEDVELINDGESLACAPGILTEKMFLAYVEVETESIEKGDRVFGLREEAELIMRVFVPVKDAQKMFFEDMKTFALVNWFFANKKHGLTNVVNVD